MRFRSEGRSDSASQTTEESCSGSSQLAVRRKERPSQTQGGLAVTSIVSLNLCANSAAWTAKIVLGLSGVTIKHVACGDNFGACLSDRGIVMTFGNGAMGVLGHGNHDDVESPRIVEALLGFEVKQVRCGCVRIHTADQAGIMRQLTHCGRHD